MIHNSDICACCHARHFHALKLVAGGYRNDQCWAAGCYCAEFEHEPSELRDAGRPSATASVAETVTTPRRAEVKAGPVVCESSPAADGDRGRAPLLAHNELQPAAAHTAPAA